MLENSGECLSRHPARKPHESIFDEIDHRDVWGVGHSMLFVSCGVFELVGSLNGLQGDAVQKADAHPEVTSFLIWFFKTAVAILSWPGSLFTGKPQPLHVSWFLNSLVWGLLLLCLVACVLKGMKKSPTNASRVPGEPSEMDGLK